jgi:hypothetical protein
MEGTNVDEVAGFWPNRDSPIIAMDLNDAGKKVAEPPETGLFEIPTV